MRKTRIIFSIEPAQMYTSELEHTFNVELCTRVPRVYISLDKNGLTPEYDKMERSILKQLGLNKSFRERIAGLPDTCYLVSWHTCRTKFSVIRRFRGDESDDYRTVLLGQRVY